MGLVPEHGVDMIATLASGLAFTCPACGVSLVTTGDSLTCPSCLRRATFDPHRRLLDLGAFLEASSSVEQERVGLAYRFYSLVYAPLALLNMWFVWRASLKELVDHYRAALGSATGEVLDVAIGDGALFRLVLAKLAAAPPVLGLDISDRMLVKAARALSSFPGLRLAHADACALPLPAGSFRTVCCYGGLHVIAHPKRAMQEITRVLEPGGLFWASILTRPAGRFPMYLARRYVELGFLSTDFTTQEATRLLEEAGLSPRELRMNGKMLLATAEKPLG